MTEGYLGATPRWQRHCGSFRLLAALTVFLGAATPGWSATTRYVAVNGRCARHATMGTAFVSCADSVSAGCTAAKPCCTLREASAKTTGAGDTVEMHDGTFVDAIKSTDQSLSCSASSANDYFAIFPAKGSTAVNATLNAALGDTPILDLAGNEHNGLLIIRNGTVVNGIRTTGGIASSSDSWQQAHIRVCDVDETGGDGTAGGGKATRYVTLTNVFVNYSNQSLGTTSSNLGVEAKASEFFRIENSTVQGMFDFAILVRDTDSPTGTVIRHNTINEQKTSSEAQRGIMLELLGSEPSSDATNASQAGTALIYDNTLSRPANASGTSYPFYFREIHWKIYAWNNFVTGGQICFWLQDDLCSGSPAHFHDEQQFIFNNTCIAGSGGDNGVRWPNNYALKLKNNIFKGYGYGVMLGNYGSTQNCATRDDAPRGDASSTISNDLCWQFTTCKKYGGGQPDLTTTALVTGADPLVDATGHIGAGSSAIGAGTNNPIGQGPGVCSVTCDSMVANCALDMDDQDRGAAWDIGADQLGTGSGATAPPAPVNVRRIDKKP